MKRVIALLIGISMLVIFMAGCSPSQKPDSTEPETKPTSENGEPSEPSEEEFTVGFSVITLNIEYYAIMKDAFEEMCDQRGWKYLVTESGQDVEATLNDCADLIHKGVDALVIASWYGDSMGEVYELAAEADVPVFFINTGGLEDGDPYISHVLADDYDTGKFIGYWTAKYFINEKQKSDIRFITLTTATSIGRNRMDGFVEGLKDGGVNGDWLHEYLFNTREDALAATEDALITYPEIDLIHSCSDVAELGSYDAVAAAGRTEVIINGWDIGDEQKELISGGTQFVSLVDVDPVYEMLLTLDNVEAYHEGKTVEKYFTYYPKILTAEGYVTYDEVMGKE